MASYIDHANHFWAIRITRDDLNERETTVFFWLLHVASRQGWPSEFEASTAALCRVLNCTRQSFTRARDRLKTAQIIEFTEGSRAKCPRYSFVYVSNYAQKTRSTDTQPVTRDKTDKQTERADRAGSSSTLSIFEIKAEMEKHFPKRADVSELIESASEYYAAKGSELTATKARKWIANEREPKFKPPPVEQEPAGWERAFNARFPDADTPGSWHVFKQKFPDIAADLKAELSKTDT